MSSILLSRTMTNKSRSEYLCPECKGEGVTLSKNNDDTWDGFPCYYCDGMGFASDADPEEKFYNQVR